MGNARKLEVAQEVGAGHRIYVIWKVEAGGGVPGGGGRWM